METRDKILEAALELFVENGLYGVATSKISKKAGVSAGILFHHFETKDKLIAELYTNTKASFMKQALESVSETENLENKLRSVWNNMLNCCSSKPLVSKFCRQIEHSPFFENVKESEKMKPVIKMQNDMFRAGIESGELKDMPEEFLTNLFSSMQSAVVIYLQANPKKMNDNKFMDSAWASVWCALKK
jgi:AcrR family transcriptional regulator